MLVTARLAYHIMSRPLEALLLLLMLLRLAAAAANTDWDALLAFKAGVSDPSGVLRSWNDKRHFCRWAGVRCTGGRVTSLNLSYQGLEGTISPAIGNLTSLEFLGFDRTGGLSGSIPTTLGRLRRLHYLGLCDNSFQGDIPDTLRNCTSLTTVYLNNNHFTGTIPTWFGTLPNLTMLWLSHNSLSGHIPPSLANLTNLQSLQLDQNHLEGTLPDGLSRLPALSDLTVYQNNLSGEIALGFFNMSSLIAFSVANNAFRGMLPPYAGAHMPSLQYLMLGGNNLSGPIPASLSNASSIQYISLANNSFNGRVPIELGKLCPTTLQMSNNLLMATDTRGWEFLALLTNCSVLQELSLDGNMLGGTMPSSIANLPRKLRRLNLGSNQISGAIPSGIGKLVELQTLDLQSNLLTGTIPKVIGKLKKLEALRLQANKLTGPIPSSLGNLTQLLNLLLSNNSLSGSIPPSLGSLQELTLLNLSGNALTGPVPKELFGLSLLSSAMDLSDNRLDGPLHRDVGRLTNLALLALSGNRFSSEVPVDLENCQSLEFLYLDRNSFGGSIPPSLRKLKGLRRLNLANNNLSGGIPPELGLMSGLEQLDLSWNDLSGDIPEELENMSSLIELDLSHNRLEGRVPVHGVFANLTGFKMAGNGALCGGVTQLHMLPCPVDSARHASLLLEIAVPVVGVALFLAILFIVLLSRKRKFRNAVDTTAHHIVDVNNYPRVSHAELAKSTDGYSDANLIGAGKYGSVYLGVLPLKLKGASVVEDVTVAVKVFDLRQVGGSKTFLTECKALQSIRHRNLISIITCCSSVDARGNEFKALVFEFMPNYSLDTWLHPKAEEGQEAHSLSLIQRLNIAVDVADALHYLHNNCNPPMIHCDLKPSNVLLDEDLTAHVGDFGLAKLLLDPGSHAAANSECTIGIRGTIGYVAPEYGTTGKVSTSGDAYSFGITLLEIFVGKLPTDDAFKDGLTLHEFVSRAFPERIEQILDPALLPIEEFDAANGCSEENGARIITYDCLVSVIRVGLNCSRQAPSERMSMRDAAAQMRVIRDGCVRACGE